MSQVAEVSTIISPVFQVGGSVRDEILGITPSDYDYATPLSPDAIEARAKAAGKRVYTVGKKFGTIGFKMNGEIVEVTSFRKELYIPGNRKPSVEFVDDIRTDLSRRDFTINAIAKDELGGIVDPFNGRDDLNNHVLRAVGNPSLRFTEDPLRLLRMCRFVGQFNLTVDPATLKAAQDRAFMILHISKERWIIELDKILSQSDPILALEMAHNIGLLRFMLPELDLSYGYDQMSPYHSHTLWTHTMEVIKLVPNDTINLRWVALFHDLGKPYARTVKLFNKDAVMKDPQMQALRDAYTLPMQANYVHHERISAEIARRYCVYFKFSNERSEYIINHVAQHMTDDAILKPYDREGH